MIESLNKIKYQLDNLEEQSKQIEIALKGETDNINILNKELDEIIEAKQYYKKAIDIMYERSVVELKDILNSALAYAFKNRNFEMDIVISDNRGKSMTFVITENGKPANLKTAMGMGVKCVISAVLQMYYLQCKNSNILLLDEAYSAISKSYVPEFFDFLKHMCDKLNFKIIIITHDERFLQFGDKSYTFDQGEVSVR